MKNLFGIKLSLVIIVLGALFAASCEKDDIDIVKEEVVETEVPIENVVPSDLSENTMLMQFQGARSSNNAYASYCNANNMEVWAVSNNPALVGTNPIDISQAQVNDYLIQHHVMDTLGTTYTYTTNSYLYEDTTQTPAVKWVVTDASPTVTFSTLNSTTVVGRLSGTYLNPAIVGFGGSYNTVFNATVTSSSTLCN